MSKFNPLFVDSTRTIGDKVVTQVKLRKILLYDDEVLYFEVIDKFSFTQRFALGRLKAAKVGDAFVEEVFGAEIWLKYQHLVSYRYVIETDGQVTFVSEPKQTRAGHLITDLWEPTFAEPEAVKLEPHEALRSEFMRTHAVTVTKQNFSRNLTKPYFFEKIKTLLEDLL